MKKILSDTNRPYVILWGSAILYVLFIYATLGVIRGPTNFLREHGLLRIILGTIFGLCFGGAIIGLILKKAREWWRYAITILVFLSYFLITKEVQQPEEQIHFFEYGLVGILFARAFRLHFQTPWKYLLAAFVLGTLVGCVDEIIQGILPSRYYDNRDIALNAISVAFGLLLYSSFPHKRFDIH